MNCEIKEGSDFLVAKEASFDIVSEINQEEVKNAIALAKKKLPIALILKGLLAKLSWKKIN